MLTLSNLYPRPDRPQYGLFNAQLFQEMDDLLADANGIENICLVPEWRFWRWATIRAWQSPDDRDVPTTYCPVFYWPLIGRHLAPRTYALSGRKLHARFEAESTVLVSWLYPDGVMAARMAATAGAAVWVMVLGTDTEHLAHPVRRRQIVAASRNIRGFICVAQHLADRLIAAGIGADRISVVPNGVNARLFHYRDGRSTREALRRAAQSAGRQPVAAFLDVDTPTILFVGNLVAVKAPDDFLEAFLLARSRRDRRDPPLRAVFLGDGPMRAALEARAAAAGGGVLFAGSVSPSDVAQWMAISDCLCLTSRNEGMPNVIAEALATGLPVVCTNVGACREMVDGVDGARLVPAGDREAIARALVENLDRLVERPAIAERHGQYTRRDQAMRILNLMDSYDE